MQDPVQAMERKRWLMKSRQAMEPRRWSMKSGHPTAARCNPLTISALDSSSSPGQGHNVEFLGNTLKLPGSFTGHMKQGCKGASVFSGKEFTLDLESFIRGGLDSIKVK